LYNNQSIIIVGGILLFIGRWITLLSSGPSRERRRPRDSFFDFRVFVRVSKPDFPQIFCSSFKLFEHQTVRSSRVHCTWNRVLEKQRVPLLVKNSQHFIESIEAHHYVHNKSLPLVPADVEGRCEYTESAVVDNWQVIVFQRGGWMRNISTLWNVTVPNCDRRK
jgi:hypothetical protein